MYANIINNDFLIKEILDSTKAEKIVDNKLLVVSKNDYIINYINDNTLEISKIFNEISNEQINVVATSYDEFSHLIKNHETNSTPYNDHNYLNKSLNFNNYIIGEFNKNAYSLIKEIVENGRSDFNPIFIYSSTGLGKTHLTSALANSYQQKFPNKSVCYIDAINFTKEIFQAIQHGGNKIEELKEQFSNYDLLIIDDVQYLADKTKTNEVLFHIFNNLIKNNKILIMTADKSPDNLHGFEERMISRFASGITTKIKNPDEETIKKIIIETINSTNLIMDDSSYQFIYQWFNNDIRILIGALNKIIFFSKNSNSRTIDENTIKEILDIESKVNIIKNNSANKEKYINPGAIINNVAKLYNLSINDITGESRKKEIVFARHIIMYILKQEFNMSYKEIGSLLGNRDHTTVMNGVEKTKELILKDKELKNVINTIIKKI